MKIFKHKKRKNEVQREDTPYTNARKSWNDHVGAIAASRQSWQIIGILSLLICLTAIGGLIHIGSQSKFVPYVVEVDKLGQSVAVAAADKAKKVDLRVVRANLAEWVNNMRMVTPDIAIQRRAILRGYALLSLDDPAVQKTHEWLNGSEENNPFNRAERVTVTVDIDSVIAQSPDTWQIDWIETVRDRQGVIVKEPFRMRALLNVYIKHPDSTTSEEVVRKNPLGLYIRDYNWSQQI